MREEGEIAAELRRFQMAQLIPRRVAGYRYQARSVTCPISESGDGAGYFFFEAFGAAVLVAMAFRRAFKRLL